MGDEHAIKRFFFTIANNPLYYTPSYQSLLRMVDKYLDSLKAIPHTSAYYRYSQWIIMGLLIKTGQGQRKQILEPRVMADDYKDGLSFFSKDELMAFESRRRAFIEVLKQIASGRHLHEVKGLDTIIIRANELQPTRFFTPPG